MGKEAAQTEQKNSKKKVNRRNGAPIRIWAKAIFSGFRRSRHTQNSNQVILKVQGVNDREQTNYYKGKRVVYIYKAQNSKKNTKFRTIWGKITRTHGNSGQVNARFNNNLPPRAIGSTLRVMLYPQRN